MQVQVDGLVEELKCLLEIAVFQSYLGVVQESLEINVYDFEVLDSWNDLYDIAFDEWSKDSFFLLLTLKFFNLIEPRIDLESKFETKVSQKRDLILITLPALQLGVLFRQLIRISLFDEILDPTIQLLRLNLQQFGILMILDRYRRIS